MTNKRTTRTLEFDVMDAPVLMHALLIGANTAMLCGKPGAQARLRQYVAILREIAPDESKLFDAEDWCELGLALATAKKVQVGLKNPKWRGRFNRDYAIQVTIGTKHWFSDKSYFMPGAEEVGKLSRLLAEIAPVGCEIVQGAVTEDADV